MTPSRLFLMLAIVSLAAIPFLARPVAADTNTGTSGQPNQSCQSVFPSGPLSPAGFNTNGFSVADTHYAGDRKSTRLNSSHRTISYAVFCLKKKKTAKQNTK